MIGLRWSGMCSPRRLSALVAVMTIGLANGGCTLVKPLVGAVTGPVIILGNSADGGCFNGDWRGIGCALASLAVIGAVGGLVTGIVSDVRVLTESAQDPTDNWWDPFAINR